MFNKMDYDSKYYQALLDSEELWAWLSDNAPAGKSGHPNFKVIERLDHECPMCEYMNNHFDDFYDFDSGSCANCVLGRDKKSICQTEYHEWLLSDGQQRYKYAVKIYLAILEERLRIMELHI